MSTRIASASASDLQISNTRQMSLAPQPALEFEQLSPRPRHPGVAVMLLIKGDLFKSHVDYPVMVEMWDRAKSGKHKRRWLKEFSAAERAMIGRYYGRFYRWHLMTGTPLQVGVRIKTLELLQKAVAFFGSI